MTLYLQKQKSYQTEILHQACPFMARMTHAKFYFNQMMVTLIFGIRASELPSPPRARRMTEKAGPDRVKKALAITSDVQQEGCLRRRTVYIFFVKKIGPRVTK